jgi:hypothetical protein
LSHCVKLCEMVVRGHPIYVRVWFKPVAHPSRHRKRAMHLRVRDDINSPHPEV